MKIFFENRMLNLVNFQIDDDLPMSLSQFVDNKNETEIVESFLGSPDGNELVINECNKSAMQCALQERFRRVDAAGGIVLVDGKILTIVRNAIPDLPKGHVESGEDFETAAIREVTEETGQEQLTIVRRLPDSWHCYLYNEQWTLKRTAWFLMTTNSSICNKPQEEEGITQIELVDNKTVTSFLNNTYRSIRENLGEVIVAILSK